MQHIKKIVIGIVSFLVLMVSVQAQTPAQVDSILISDLERTFMPTVQMGYVHHGTAELTGGLMVQTSLEYRDISNFIFRINYDNFNSNIRVEYPLNQDVTFTGRTSFSELIGGVGYRHQMNKHSLTLYVQPGFRLYGYPEFNIDSTQANLDFDSRRIGMIRYSFGYEYELAPKLFFTIEALLSHVLRREDFWTENVWSYGVTVGISAPIF